MLRERQILVTITKKKSMHWPCRCVALRLAGWHGNGSLEVGGGTAGPVTGIAGKSLDIQGAATADGTQVQMYDCNGTGAQTWQRDGQTLRALGKCLDAEGYGTADGTKVQLWSCHGDVNHRWATLT
jgi:hypothetical protein